MRNLREFLTNAVLFIILLSFMAISALMYFGIGGTKDIYDLSGMFIPDMNIFHSNDSLMEYFDAWGAQGRLFYIRYQYRDFIYPIIYSVLMSAILIRLIQPKYFNFWVIVPMFAMLFDFAENYFLRVLVYDYPNLDPQNISYATVFSSLKWMTILFSLILILIAFSRRRIAYIKSQEE